MQGFADHSRRQPFGHFQIEKGYRRIDPRNEVGPGSRTFGLSDAGSVRQ